MLKLSYEIDFNISNKSNMLLSLRRFCSNEELFDDLISKSEKLKDVRVALGGNAPVMANRFAIEGANVLLAAKMTKKFQQTIHENIQVVGDLIESDDIHLILEYKRNEKWGTLQSPRANRFIIHSDINNPTISSVESFDEPLKKYHPDLMVVGMHILYCMNVIMPIF